MSENRNARLRDRIDSATARNALESSREAARNVIHDHPVAALAGGILVGALIARAIPKKPSRKIGSRASALAAVAAEAALAFASKASDASRKGAKKLESGGSSVASHIGEGSEEARRRAAEIAEIAAAGAKEATQVARRRLAEIASRLRR